MVIFQAKMKFLLMKTGNSFNIFLNQLSPKNFGYFTERNSIKTGLIKTWAK